MLKGQRIYHIFPCSRFVGNQWLNKNSDMRKKSPPLCIAICHLVIYHTSPNINLDTVWLSQYLVYIGQRKNSGFCVCSRVRQLFKELSLKREAQGKEKHREV